MRVERSGYAWLHDGFDVEIEMVEVVNENRERLPTVHCDTCKNDVVYDVEMYDVIKPNEIPEVHCPSCFDIIPLKKKDVILPRIIDVQCRACKNVKECDHDKGGLPCICFLKKMKQKKKPFQQPSLAKFMK